MNKKLMFTLDITVEQYNTIKAALDLELQKYYGKDENTVRLLKNAIEAVSNAKVKN